MSEIVASVLVIGVMAAAAVSLSGSSYWDEFAPGPAFMPYWIVGLGCLIAVLLIVQSVRSKFATSEDQTDFSDIKKAGFVVVLLCALLFAIPWVGMLIGSTLMILAILIGMQGRPVVPSLISAAVTAAIVYGVFELWLKVDLPRSPLGI